MPLTPEFEISAGDGKRISVAELKELVELIKLCEVSDSAVITAKITFKGEVRSLGVKQS